MDDDEPPREEGAMQPTAPDVPNDGRMVTRALAQPTQPTRRCSFAPCKAEAWALARWIFAAPVRDAYTRAVHSRNSAARRWHHTGPTTCVQRPPRGHVGRTVGGERGSEERGMVCVGSCRTMCM